MKIKTLHLDGRTLEGGGQLIRIALALSALTNKPLTIDHIRANRKGKTGLKVSHLAAVRFLAEVSNSVVEGAEIGSASLSFHPSGISAMEKQSIQQRYTISLSTPGSVFLVLQALYPYLLHAGGLASLTDAIRVDITGGTNVSFSPSFDYIAQVLCPNLARLGLPRLSVQLDKRGWGTGPVDLGAVSCFIHPVSVDAGPERASNYGFPLIDLRNHVRGEVTQIDVTVLAPDNVIHASNEDKLTIREFIENETIQELHRRLPDLPSWVFQTPDPETTVPIQIHTSERTYHPSQIYVLIVAHTSTGFRIGRDALSGESKETSTRSRLKRHKKNQSKDDETSPIQQLIKRCIDRFLNEIYNPSLEDEHSHHPGKHPPCVDEYMRDQLVIFEALGKVSSPREEEQDGVSRTNTSTNSTAEDDRYWSLHTQTARWVCEQVLGVEW